MFLKTALAAAGLCAAVAVGLTGCSSSGSDSPSSTGSAAKNGSASAGGSSSRASSGSSSDGAMAAQPFGSACTAVPKTGAGSFNGMATDPVATAASHNPVLSTLVTAVTKAGLVDTLNSQQGITVFAPYNGAFAKIDKATLNKVLADKAALTKILTYHVVGGRLSPDELPGSHKTLEGGTVVVKGSAPNLTAGPKGSEAHVICGNVQTANATVYIVDSVMMPPAS